MKRVPFEVMNDDIMDGFDFEHEGEKYIFVEELKAEMDDNGRYRDYIYKRESDGEYFKINLKWARYGYEDYSFESFMNDGELEPTHKEEIVIYRWV